MEESIFYIAEGNPADKHSQESFALSTSSHTSQQHASFRQADCPQNGAVLTGIGKGERLIVVAPNKALLNIYSWGKESPDQKIPVPEQLTCLALCHHPNPVVSGESRPHSLPSFRLPWLLAAGSKSGKIYVWELSSGNLLCVKESHYQQVSSIKFSSCGTFLVTGGYDARVMIWRTLDLISIYSNQDDERNIKPYHSITDNSLPLTNILLSLNGIVNDLKLYTASRDSTLRVYDIITKTLLTTFILPYAIESLTKDPANRAIYCGLSNGLIRTVPLYKINQHTSVLESIGGNSKIITLDNDPNLLSTFVHHQQRINTEAASNLHKATSKANDEKPILVTQLDISLDGTSIISGDSLGRVFVSDIVTRQVLKTFTPCNSPISYIQINACPFEVSNNSGNAGTKGKNDKKHRLIPQLKRVLASNEPIEHQLYLEIPGTMNLDDEMDTETDATPFGDDEEDFEKWLVRKSQEELAFKNLSNINSSVKILGDSANGLVNNKVTDLQEKLDTVAKAYTELRTKHEQLLSEHSKLLNQ